MKFRIFFVLLIFVFVLKVNALEYEIVNKEVINYEINNFYISGDNIIINGWAIIDGDVQHFIDSSTHSYSLYIENIYDSKDNYTYSATMLNADKTSMYKYTTTSKVCSLTSTYNDAYSCYTRYENVGFEFSIPLEDLTDDSEYQIYLQVYGKTAGVKYQIAIYAPNINESYISGGIEYSLESDFSSIEVTVITEHLFVRSGPDVSLNEVYGSYSKCSYGTRLYWGEYETFSTLQEVYQSSSSYDSDTWFRILYNEGLCQDSRSRAIMGYSYSGWIASVHTDFSGKPATIKTTVLESINMGDIVTYTSEAGEYGTLSISFESEISQNIKLDVYYLGKLVESNNYNVSGEKELSYDILLSSYGKVEIIITEENGTEHSFFSEIYTSSSETYYVFDATKIINPSTPVMVIKNGNNVDYIYEQIEVTIPYNYIKLSSGSSLQAWSLINYTSGNNNITLNSDISVYGEFSSSEGTLELSDGKITYEKTASNNYQALFNLPIMYLSNPEGEVYLNYDDLSSYVNGGRMWYTPIDDEFGVYDYSINVYNIGVNSINVVFMCTYETSQSIYGNSSSEYVIIRVETPSEVEYFLNENYDSEYLDYYKSRLGL